MRLSDGELKTPPEIEKKLGYTISGQTVGNVLKRHGLSPALERSLDAHTSCHRQ